VKPKDWPWLGPCTTLVMSISLGTTTLFGVLANVQFTTSLGWSVIVTVPVATSLVTVAPLVQTMLVSLKPSSPGSVTTYVPGFRFGKGFVPPSPSTNGVVLLSPGGLKVKRNCWPDVPPGTILVMLMALTEAEMALELIGLVMFCPPP